MVPGKSVILLIFLSAGALVAQTRPLSKSAAPYGARTIAQESGVLWSKKVLQGFNMQVWLNNQLVMGIEAWDPYSVPVEDCGIGIGCRYPAASSCVEHIFGAAPWIGAIVNGVRRVTEGYNGDDARMEFVPDIRDTARERFWWTSVLNTGEPNRKGVDDDGDGLIDEDELDGKDNDGDWSSLLDDVGADGIPDSLETGCKGSYDPVNNPDPAFDNYDPTRRDTCHPNPNTGALPAMNDRNKYTEHNGIPDHGEPHVDEDYGAVSYNDLTTEATDTVITGSPSGHVPIGAEVLQKSYAWSAGAAEAAVFFEYTVRNLRSAAWQDAYLAVFADMDVGPVTAPNYFLHNVAAYDSLTRTAYVYNALDSGSTPLGVTFLGTSYAEDSLRLIFRWVHIGDLGTLDSTIYGLMSGETGPDIMPDQSPNLPGDARLFLSRGPMQLNQGDSVTVSYALVSGATIEEMLANARRAHTIYEHRYFLMPVVTVDDSGGGKPVTVSWEHILRSPYGPVVGSTLYYGTDLSSPSDSLTTQDFSAVLTGLNSDSVYYFTVSLTDDQGNRSGRSDPMTNVSRRPHGLLASGGEVAISLRWDRNTDLDLGGYRLYRHTLVDTVWAKLGDVSPVDTAYLDTDVRGDQTYYYALTAVDIDGHESERSLETHAHLIPPATPSDFHLGAGKTYIYLYWTPNTEPDLAGYNIYRSLAYSHLYVKLNPSLWREPTFIDSTLALDSVYSYYVEAVDTTGAASAPTGEIVSGVAPMDQGILVYVDARYNYGYGALAFYDSLLSGLEHRTTYANFNALFYDPHPMEPYSTVIIVPEDTGRLYQPLQTNLYPYGLKGYLLGGGRVVIAGRGLMTSSYPYWYLFLRDFFGVDLLSEKSSDQNFLGADGVGGYPSVILDTARIPFPSKRLGNVERLHGMNPDRTVYTFRSAPLDPAVEGMPVGIKVTDDRMHAFYLTFPPYYLDTTDARALLEKLLAGVGEIPDAVSDLRSVPASFRLYDAYPNPFNPSTTIEFDLERTSEVSLLIYDLLGRKQSELVSGVRAPGHYAVSWDGSTHASGVYFCRLVARTSAGGERRVATNKLLLVK